MPDKENLEIGAVTLYYGDKKVSAKLSIHGNGNKENDTTGQDEYWVDEWCYYEPAYGFEGEAKTRTVDLNVALDLNFNVTEATVTTVSTSQSRVTKTTVNEGETPENPPKMICSHYERQ